MYQICICYERILNRKQKNYRRTRRILRQSNDRLLKRIEKLAVSESAEINSVTSDVIVNKNQSGFPPDSPKHLLWEQQKKLCRLKKKTSMRWHHVMIRWCLSIYLKSPGYMDSAITMQRNTGNINWYTGNCETPHSEEIGLFPSSASPIFSIHYPQILFYEL